MNLLNIYKPILRLLAVFVLALLAGQAVAADNPNSGRAEQPFSVPVMRKELTVQSEHGENEGKPRLLSLQEKLRLGERMYREGILPSGEALKASSKEDILVNSTAFSCVSCHMRGGLGSVEGGITTPPATGNRLFKPSYSGTILTSSPRVQRKRFVVNPARRAAYTESTLAVALRSGINPDGRKLDDTMPRYQLQDTDMAILIDYLKSLSANLSPGVDNTTLRLGTIITDDVSPENRKAMLEALDNFVTTRNAQDKVYAARSKYMRGGGFPEEANLAYRTLSLARWELKGAPETWRAQLEELNRKEPVFALIGGITTGEWQPIHNFCEAQHIPCLFPITDLPVISATDWYTMYFSKGLYQEGEAAARFLGRSEEISPDSVVVQIVRNSRESRALAAGFSDTSRELGQRPPVTITLNEDEPVSRDFLLQLVATHKPYALLIWTGSEILPALYSIAEVTHTPKFVFASAGYLKKAIWDLPEKVRGITYITYPYRLPPEPVPASGNSSAPVTRNNAEHNNEQLISAQAQAITEVLQLGLSMMNLNFYRDTFFDLISMIPDQTPQAYERLNFSPGQRYASKGCNIVQLSGGANPGLVKKSDWVIH